LLAQKHEKSMGNHIGDKNNFVMIRMPVYVNKVSQTQETTTVFPYFWTHSAPGPAENLLYYIWPTYVPMLNRRRYLGKSSLSHFQYIIHVTIYSRVIWYFFQVYFWLFENSCIWKIWV